MSLKYTRSWRKITLEFYLKIIEQILKSYKLFGFMHVTLNHIILVTNFLDYACEKKIKRLQFVFIGFPPSWSNIIIFQYINNIDVFSFPVWF